MIKFKYILGIATYISPLTATVKHFIGSLLLVLLFTPSLLAQDVIDVSGAENGLRMHGKYLIWKDPTSTLTVTDAQQAYARGEFEVLQTKGSTGLTPGAVWSHFYLRNVSDRPVTLNLEYVDHQLIWLDAFSATVDTPNTFSQIAQFALDKPFSERLIPHHRFVFATSIAAGESKEYLIKLASHGNGFVFPNLRIWSPSNLMLMQTKEASLVNFLFGGLLLMAIISLVAGIATKEGFFYADSAYMLSKIIAWGTILGYTHEFVLTEQFHWSYMSIAAAISIFCGLLFSRIFLQSKKYTPKLDYVLQFMMGNAVFLLACAVFKLTALAVLSITVALFLYPVVIIVGVNRWMQGSKEAAVFALGWSFLVIGLVVQALRDLGFVEHNFINYYWPIFASYAEMVVIMVAMGLRLRLLRRQKIDAEHKYTLKLEHSKAELELLVKARTKELEKQKHRAEIEARTDALTGTRNRRSFFAEAGKLLAETRIKHMTVSLLMFDIDNFKTINDTYGHNTGDEALRSFVDTIARRIRETDIFGRLGGEEFSLLLCGSKQDALQMAERLREDIANLRLETSKGPLQFTTSVGVAHLSNETMIEELLNQADKALYEAKAGGRNQVIECNFAAA
jgi:diguanylate cyclase (GGDEF)-like protein